MEKRIVFNGSEASAQEIINLVRENFKREKCAYNAEEGTLHIEYEIADSFGTYVTLGVCREGDVLIFNKRASVPLKKERKEKDDKKEKEEA